MYKQEWNDASNADFDAMLQKSLEDLPPDDIAEDVTPRRKAISNALTGLALSIVTLDFLFLDDILPLMGHIQCLLGFRTLRRENRWFSVCYVIELLRSIFFFASLIFNATVFRENAISPHVFLALQLPLALALMFCLRQGFRHTQQKAGLPVRTGGATALMAWYVLLCILALVQYSGFLIGGLMILLYILIFRSLNHLAKELEETGYAVKTAAVRLSDPGLIALILSLSAVGIICGYLFFHSYPMDWQIADPSHVSETEETRAHLVKLGFPADVLSDLTQEEIEACAGASRVVMDIADCAVTDNGEKALHLTNIAVQIPQEQETWLIFHHFRWMVDPGFYGTESILIWPIDSIEDGWKAADEISGRLLCDKDGRIYTAPYYHLGREAYTTDGLLGGSETNSHFFAAFSLPKDAANQRGYVSYRTENIGDAWIATSWINYTHQNSWAQYPVTTAMEIQKAGFGSRYDLFHTTQDPLQFYPDQEEAERNN